jgi:predicted RNA-binding Zn ribbon-like protein
LNQPKQDLDVTAEDFVFFDDFLAIDFVNTEIVRRRKQYDLITTPSHLALWHLAAQRHYPDVLPPLASDVSVDVVEQIRQFRQELRAIFEHLVAHEAVASGQLDGLNHILRHSYPRLMTENRVFDIHYQSTSSLTKTWQLPLALSAVDLLTQHDLSRLRHCRNEHCILFFYDTSKNGGREWCSTACMNRARSAIHYRDAKQGHL